MCSGSITLVGVLGAAAAGSAATVRSATLNTGGNAYVNSVSCSDEGACAAGGDYRDAATSTDQAFVVSGGHGGWGGAIEVPGSGALNTGGSGSPAFAYVGSISCAGEGSCSAGGAYVDQAGHDQAFVVDERHRRVGQGDRGSGHGAPQPGQRRSRFDLMCLGREAAWPAARTRLRGTTNPLNTQAFVVTESHGVWGTAITVPGTASLNSGGNAVVNSVSCPVYGDCVAGGYYTDGITSDEQAFVVSQRNGVGARRSRCRARLVSTPAAAPV